MHILLYKEIIKALAMNYKLLHRPLPATDGLYQRKPRWTKSFLTQPSQRNLNRKWGAYTQSAIKVPLCPQRIVTFWGFDRIAFGSTTSCGFICIICILLSQITENAQQCELMQDATDAEQHLRKYLRPGVQGAT